jgi:hypothetical protein
MEGVDKATCNICGDVTELTDDHVPPKRCLQNRRLQMRRSLPVLMNEVLPTKGNSITQTGIRYRTICTRCNSRLGKYDRSLSAFCSRVHGILDVVGKGKLALPSLLYVRGRPNPMVRSILGHRLSMLLEVGDGTLDRACRQAILEPEVELCEDVRVFYWLHPWELVEVLPDLEYRFFFRSGFYEEHTYFQTVIRFPPVGIAITYGDVDPSVLRGTTELTRWSAVGTGEEANLPLHLATQIHEPRWPKAHGIAFNDEYHHGVSGQPVGDTSRFGSILTDEGLPS